MSRPLKFRRIFLKDSDNSFSHFSEWGIDIEHATFVSPSVNNKCHSGGDLQFTGLHDKNGKPIYEGDIRREEIEEDEGDRRMYYVCKWLPQNCSFVWMDYGDTVTNWDFPGMEFPCSLLSDECNLYIICGNIYETPNLLNQ